MGYCSCKQIGEEDSFKEPPRDGLVYHDYEGVHDCGFDTGENFGCVHHKERK